KKKTKKVDQIKKCDSDIVCLQEVDHFHDFYNLEFDKMGYECIYVQKINREEGLLTIFKKGIFTLAFQNEIMFDLKIPLKLAKNHYTRNNLCQFIQLRHNYSNKQILIANTHLYWDPRCEEVKFLQASVILEYLSTQFSIKDNIFLCGDFNSMPSSNVIKFIEEKKAPNISRIENIFQKRVKMTDEVIIYDLFKQKATINLKSSYSNYQGTAQHPDFTNYTQNFKGALDYILYNTSMEDCRLIGIQPLPINEIQKELGLPNADYPSDHLPITAYYEIQTN
ncbi:hypothetical protein IMG5_155710, partial [Ichthyophthirius multifiliis]